MEFSSQKIILPEVKKNSGGEITYDIEADIINPKFVKEKSNKDYLKVIANKASFLSESKMFLEGDVKYKSNKFILESDKVDFDQINFNASSHEKTIFLSDKIQIDSEGFKVTEKGNIISFLGKSRLEIK